jgi:hypothetical protein
MTIRRGSSWWLLVALLCAGPVQGQETSPPRTDSAFQKYARETAGSYRLETAGPKPQPLEMQAQSLLRWSNQLTGKQTAGEVFLWTDRGRPQAVASIYRFTDAQIALREQHEFCSLSLMPLTAKRETVQPWAPMVAGVEWKPIPDTTEPPSSPSRRLLEMRRLAGTFSGEKTTRDNIVRPLRLLPQPVYRFNGQHPDVLDGGLFAFVEETDPEILLLIEAQKSNDSAKWMYAAARMNSIAMRVLRNEQPVWESPLLSWGQVIDQVEQPYTVLRVANPPVLTADSKTATDQPPPKP